MPLETKLNKIKDKVVTGGLIAALGGSVLFTGCESVQITDRDAFRLFGGAVGAAIDDNNPWRGALIGIIGGDVIYQLQESEVRRRRVNGRLYYEDEYGRLYKRMKMNPDTGRVYPSSYRYDPKTGELLKDVYVPVR